MRMTITLRDGVEFTISNDAYINTAYGLAATGFITTITGTLLRWPPTLAIAPAVIGFLAGLTAIFLGFAHTQRQFRNQITRHTKNG